MHCQVSFINGTWCIVVVCTVRFINGLECCVTVIKKLSCRQSHAYVLLYRDCAASEVAVVVVVVVV